MKTNVYVDGFNLYYGALKNTPYKWLNIRRLCELLLPRHQIGTIKYFTAHVKPRSYDPQQHSRQQIYLRALRTLPSLEIILGRFLSNTRKMRLASPPNARVRYVSVLYTEEKGSDVNLASHLLLDGFRQNYTRAVLISNDSDLTEPVRIIRQEFHHDVIILNPHKKPSAELKRYATMMRPIRQGPLKASQFPSILSDTRGTFHKPASW